MTTNITDSAAAAILDSSGTNITNSFADEVLADTPTVFWLLNEASGTTAVDISGNGYSGIYAGTYTQHDAGISSRLPYCVSATNSDVVTSSATNINVSTTAVTLEAVVYVTAVNCAILASQTGTGATTGATIFIDGSQKLVFTVNSTGDTLTTTASFPLNQWVHVVAVYDSSTMEVFYDGVSHQSKGPNTGAILLPSGRKVKAGAHDNTSLQLRGKIASAAFYDGIALGSTRIAAHYGALIPTGTAAVTTADATCAASGTFTASGVTGTASITLADATVSAAGSSVTGTAAVSLADATVSASGGHGPSGSAAVTLDSATSVASGSSVTGTVAITLDDATCAASGTAASVTGTVAVTTADASVSASGSTVVGSVSVVLSDATVAGSGTYTPATVTGTLAVTLADATCTASGFFGSGGSIVTVGEVGWSWAARIITSGPMTAGPPSSSIPDNRATSRWVASPAEATT